MLLREMVPAIQKIGLNLYDMALFKDQQIEEYHFQPCSNCNNCYSVAKAFAMTAVGMLYDDGLLDVDKPISRYMSFLIPDGADPAWQTITVRNVLTHKIGFSEGFLDIDVENVNEYTTDDYLSIVFQHPLQYLPGEHYQYSDAAYYLISRLVSAIINEKMDVFLNRRLFQPLHFREVAWSHCPRDYPIGATGLYISSGDMVKLGALYMDGGLWNGKRVLSEKWVNMAIDGEFELRPRTPSGLIGKGGMYSQMLLFSRTEKFAIAWHAHNTNKQLMEQLMDYIDEHASFDTNMER